MHFMPLSLQRDSWLSYTSGWKSRRFKCLCEHEDEVCKRGAPLLIDNFKKLNVSIHTAVRYWA